MEYIEARSSNSVLGAEYTQLGLLFEKKLWHELTLELEKFVDDERVVGENLLELYKGFLSKFETRLNPLKLAYLLSKIGRSLNNPNEAISFYKSILAVSKSKLGIDASLCLEIDIAAATIQLGLHEETKKLLEDIFDSLPKSNSADTLVYSKFYETTTELRKIIGPPQEFYNAALQYLAYTSIDSLKSAQKYSLATDIALAAITGDQVYNFGEVLTNPIFNVLKGTPNEWLCQLITAFHHGNIIEFNTTLATYTEAFHAQPALASRKEEIKKKMVLLSLITMIFERHPHDRLLSFNDISIRTQLPINQIEWVLMKALSLHLIKGHIDQIEQTIEVTWVIPRVLDMEQIKYLNTQLVQWSEKTKSALMLVEERSPELYM